MTGTSRAGASRTGTTEAEARRTAPRSVTIRRSSLVIAFLTALTSAGAAFLVGWTMQWREMSRVKETHDALTAALGAKVSALEVRVVRLEARRQLALALSAVDERNFGIASEHLTSAGRTMQKAPTGDEMVKLAVELQKFRLVATENLAEQRSRILAWGKTLDKLLADAR